MKKQEVLNYINENKSVGINDIFLNFNCETKNDRKRAEQIIKELVFDDLAYFDKNEKKVSIPEFKKKVKNRKEKLKPRNISKSYHKDHKKNSNDATHDFNSIIEKYEIRKDFQSNVMMEADEIENTIDGNELKRRLDLRNKMIITIDGADAKDLDDAVSIENSNSGWNLGVHIADVSYYVQQDSKLDKEARKRANSFYFINKVVPMFPKKLSNVICSLNPGEDRLTLSVIMKIDKTGVVKKYEIRESVIHSKHRLTYDWVQNYLDGKIETDDNDLKESLNQMNLLFRILYNKRINEGGIDFDFKEQKCELDENDEPVKVWLKDRQDSERIIEEFMLIANQIAAKFLSEKGVSLYRIHGEPAAEKLQDFVRIALKFGHKIYGVPVPDTKDLQRILEEARDKPHKELVNQILLRSMQQAKYDTENIGHYGLGFGFYTHFTSPIRRYADLIIHRLIKNNISKNKNSLAYLEEQLVKIAGHISSMERVAMEAERDFYKIKAVRFMVGREGKIYEGLITGVSSFGIFVQIKKYGIEGLVRFADMDDDYYIFDENNFSAYGKRRKKKFTIGDTVRIEVARVNVARMFIDFVFAE